MIIIGFILVFAALVTAFGTRDPVREPAAEAVKTEKKQKLGFINTTMVMRKIRREVLIVAALSTLRCAAPQTEQIVPPEEAAEGDELNPRLWYKLVIVDERAELLKFGFDVSERTVSNLMPRRAAGHSR